MGLRDYLIYLEGNGTRDPLFLQMKGSRGRRTRRICRSDRDDRTSGEAHGGRQRAMQFQSDPFLGWTTIANRDYLVRQLNDHKGSIAIEDLAGRGRSTTRMCGELLARDTRGRATRV